MIELHEAQVVLVHEEELPPPQHEFSPVAVIMVPVIVMETLMIGLALRAQHLRERRNKQRIG
jgi:hypothetical protein